MAECAVAVIVTEVASAPIVTPKINPSTVILAAGAPRGERGISGPSIESRPYVIAGIVYPEELPGWTVYLEPNEEQYLVAVDSDLKQGIVHSEVLRNRVTLAGFAVESTAGKHRTKPSSIKLNDGDYINYIIKESISNSEEFSFTIHVKHVIN